MQQFLKRLEKRQNYPSSDSNSPNVTLEFLEHEVEDKITLLRRELAKGIDGNEVHLREELNNISDFFGNEIHSLRSESHKNCDEKVLSLEKKILKQIESLRTEIQEKNNSTITACTQIMDILDGKLNKFQEEFSSFKRTSQSDLTTFKFDISTLKSHIPSSLPPPIPSRGEEGRCCSLEQPFGMDTSKLLKLLNTAALGAAAGRQDHLHQFNKGQGRIIDNTHQDGLHLIMWKLPMFGCTDATVIVREVFDCCKRHPEALVRLLALNSLYQVQGIPMLIQRHNLSNKFDIGHEMIELESDYELLKAAENFIREGLCMAIEFASPETNFTAKGRRGGFKHGSVSHELLPDQAPAVGGIKNVSREFNLIGETDPVPTSTSAFQLPRNSRASDLSLSSLSKDHANDASLPPGTVPPPSLLFWHQ